MTGKQAPIHGIALLFQAEGTDPLLQVVLDIVKRGAEVDNNSERASSPCFAC